MGNRDAPQTARRTAMTVDVMLDTNIIIDLLNAHPPATQWVHSRQLRLGITAITWMEVIYGAQNK